MHALSLRTSGNGARIMTNRQVRRLVARVREEGCAAVRVRVFPVLAWACWRIKVSFGIICVPPLAELALIAPQGARKHAVVLLDLPVLTRVANERADMVDCDAVPFVDLGLRWVRVVSEWVRAVEEFADAPDPIDARAYGPGEVAFRHLRRVVDGGIVPLRLIPLSGGDPADAVRVVGRDGGHCQRLGLESAPVGLVWSVLD